MFTHFISLPLATHSKLQDEVKGFQASVVSKIKQKKLIKNLIISVCFGIKFLFPFVIPFFYTGQIWVSTNHCLFRQVNYI